ncbi:ABC transporter substrate-binding protein [Elusimicrobiota bacterium]
MGEAATLDPAYAYDTASHMVFGQIYETLIGFKGSSVSEFEPRLATQVPSKKNSLISFDLKTYKFPIRGGVRFHTGEELTCEDARYSILRFMITDRPGGPSAILLEPIAGTGSTRNDKGNIALDLGQLMSQVRCDDDNTLIITLDKPFSPFLSIMASWSNVVSKKWAIANREWDGTLDNWKKFNSPAKETSHFFDHANGTGPFELERWNKSRQTVTLIRNEKYWREPAKLKKIVIRRISEFTTRKLMLSQGDADAIIVSRQFESQIAKIPGVTVADYDDMNVSAFLFNFKINPTANPYIGSGKLDGNGIPADFFTDPNVRAAFTYAYDLDTHIREISKGKAEPARGVIPKGLTGYNPEQLTYKFNLTKAREEMKKAFQGRLWEKGFKLTIPFNEGSDTPKAIANMFKRDIESLNPKFKVRIRPLLWSTYLSDTATGKVPFAYAGWIADFPDPHNFVFTFLHSKGAYASRNSFSNPALDELIEDAIEETDPKKREDLYHAITRLGFAQMPHIYSLTNKRLVVNRTWIKNHQSNPLHPNGYYFYPIYKAD